MAAWLIWLVLAGAFVVGESVTSTFVLLMCAGGAGGAAVAAALGAHAVLQIVVALILTIGLVWLVRPIAIRHSNPGAAAITGSEALVGRSAVVVTQVGRDGGLVRLNGGDWSARAKDPTQDLPVGMRVSVVAIEGATAVVWRDPLAV